MGTEKQNNKGRESLTEDVLDKISSFYSWIWNWIKPNKSQSIYLQILLFVLKLPVFIAIQILSPIFIVIMFIVFLFAI